MAHQIVTAAFSAREGAGWTGLGVAIPAEHAADPVRIAEIAGLDYTVSKADLALPNGTTLPNHQALVESVNGNVLAVVSRRKYHLDNRQPVDIVAAFRDQLAAQNMEISHVAALKGRAVVAVSALVTGKSFTIGGSDVQTYVTLSTGYDGSNGTRCTIGGVRAVCANTLAYSIAAAEKEGKIKTIRASTAIEYGSLPMLVANLDDIVSQQRRTYDVLANAHMGDADVLRTFADVLEINIEDLNKNDMKTGKPVVSTRARNMLDALLASYRHAPGAETGTAWGVLNGVTHYADHVRTVRDTSGAGSAAARLTANLIGDGARLKARALDMLTSRVALAA